MVPDYQLSRRERMNEYLNSLKKEAKKINGDESVVFLAQDFLNLLTHKLSQKNLVLEVPDCEESCDGQENFQVMFTWEKDSHYLRLHTAEDNIIEFYYKNHLSKDSLWKNYIIGQPLSEELFEKLSLFVE